MTTIMKLGKYGVFVVSGALFWVPTICVHALRQHTFGAGDITVVTALSVLVAVLTYLFLCRKLGSSLIRPLCSLLFLYGIWALGCLGTMAAASFAGGGLVHPGVLAFSLKAIVAYPYIAFVASTYDGTLGALLIITVWMILVTFRPIGLWFLKRLRKPAL